MTDLDETSGFPSEVDPGFLTDGQDGPTLFSPGVTAPSPSEFWDRSTWDPNSLGAAVFGQLVAPYRSPVQVQTDATHALLTGPSHPGWSEPITRAAIDSMMTAIPAGARPDGLLSDGMRLLAAQDHPDPGLQAWAARDAALRDGAHPLSGLWAMNKTQALNTPAGAARSGQAPGAQASTPPTLPFDQVAKIAAENNLSEGVIPDSVLVAIAYNESRFNPQARTRKSSATGLMQVIAGDNGLGEVNNQYDKSYTVQDLYDPVKNMQVASLLLARKDQMAGATGNLHKALSLYRGAKDAAVNTAYADRILKAAAALDANPKDPSLALRQAIPDGAARPIRLSH